MSEHATHPSSPGASPRRSGSGVRERGDRDRPWREKFLDRSRLNAVLDGAVRGDDRLGDVMREVRLTSPAAREHILERVNDVWDHCRAQEERCKALEAALSQEREASGLSVAWKPFHLGPAWHSLGRKAVITVALLVVLGMSWWAGAYGLASGIVVLPLVAGLFLLGQVDKMLRKSNGLRASRDRHRNAEEDLVEALKRGVALELRRLVNDRLKEVGGSPTVRPGHDLSAEPCLPDLQIMGDAHERLQERMDASGDRGGFAVVSRDGGGATTLLRWILWNRKRPDGQIRVHLEVEPGETPKDFLIRLGLAVVDEVLGRKDKTKSTGWYLRRHRARWLLRRFGWAVCLAGAAVLAYRLSPLSASTGAVAQDRIASAVAWASVATTRVETWAFAAVAVGAGLVIAGMLLAVRPRGRPNMRQRTKHLIDSLRPPRRQSDPPEVEVYGPGFELDRLDLFKVRFPLLKASEQRAASLTDMREMLREYLTSPGIQKRGILVGIDDIAKLEDPARFLDEVIRVFNGVRHCKYVVACPSGLLDRLGRDRWFTASVELEPNDFEHSERVLLRRVIGLDAPFSALCHVLAGGHPRALLNVARQVVEQPKESDFVAVCSDLVMRHVMRRRDELLEELSKRGDADRLRLWLRNCSRVLRAEPLGAQSLMAACTDYQSVEADAGNRADPTVAAHAQSLVSFMYVCATLMEFLGWFVAETPTEDGGSAGPPFAGEAGGTGEGPGALDQLARACRTASEDPVWAWELTSEFRVAWRLETFADPFVVV